MILHQAARALAKAQSGVDDWDGLDPAFQATLIENARAVLEAIREPSEGMVAALGNGEAAKWARGTWRAMIDAALAE